jgi:N-methylhydantoinase A
MFSIDVDIGGTFTDGFFTDGTLNRTAKVLTTPHDITEGLINCIEAGGAEFDLDLGSFLLQSSVARVSTTVGTNLIVQKSGPRLGLVVTKGQERKLYGQGSARVLDGFIDPAMVMGVQESVDDKGRVTKEVNEKNLLKAVRTLVQEGARMIVISFGNSWRNPANELRARDIILARYPVHYLRSVPMQLGTEVIHDANDHSRTNSAILNAYIHAEMAQTLYRGEDKLRADGFARPLLVVHANGGNARVAKTIALNTLHSGPAVAARGAAFLAKMLKLKNVVTTDMGGTSLDVSFISDGLERFNTAPQIDGVSVATPMIDVESIGAGGGSIASVADGALKVGPESAGSAPGPACYAKGGLEPTVTDANLVLGYIDPDNFLGGKMRLDLMAAQRVMKRKVADPLEKSIEEAAFNVRDAINRQMGVELVQRLGVHDSPLADMTLFSFGGSGPLHACSVAEEVGISKIYSFPFGSVFSAFGSSTTNVQHTYARTLGVPLKDASVAEGHLEQFRGQALVDMEGEGFSGDDISYAVEIDLIVSGRERTLSSSGKGVTVKKLVKDAKVSRGTIEVVRCKAQCEVPHWTPTLLKVNAKSQPRRKSVRDIYWNLNGPVETAIYDKSELKFGHKILGPAVVEAPDTAYAVNPGWSLDVDNLGNFVLSRPAR